MNMPQKDGGEDLARAMVALNEAFESWDVKQFRHKAAGEWEEFVHKLLELSQKVLDKPVQR